MSSIITKPSADRLQSSRPNRSEFDSTCMLKVTSNDSVSNFLELLELIYNVHVQVQHKDLAELMILFSMKRHQSLVGVRVAARVCKITYEVVKEKL